MNNGKTIYYNLKMICGSGGGQTRALREVVRGRSISPEERAVLHQTADKSFVCGQELRWAEEGLCTTEDSQSATGFGGEVGNVAFPGKIMADSETQKLE